MCYRFEISIFRSVIHNRISVREGSPSFLLLNAYEFSLIGSGGPLFYTLQQSRVLIFLIERLFLFWGPLNYQPGPLVVCLKFPLIHTSSFGGVIHIYVGTTAAASFSLNWRMSRLPSPFPNFMVLWWPFERLRELLLHSPGSFSRAVLNAVAWASQRRVCVCQVRQSWSYSGVHSFTHPISQWVASLTSSCLLRIANYFRWGA